MKFIVLSLALLLWVQSSAMACGGCNKSKADKSPQATAPTSTISANANAPGSTPAREMGAPVIRGLTSNQQTTRAFSSSFFDSVGERLPTARRPRGLGQRERGLRQGGGALRKPR
ncbi:MAG: hypothetical protein KDD51_01905 [Bdellovibrionales bacterium]|nr:hypothetical protein [Bdellovibrionales bacterium]